MASPAFGGVPIVGQQPQVVFGNVQAFVLCGCGHRAPIFLASMTVAGVCPSCQQAIQIDAATFTRRSDGQITVSLNLRQGQVGLAPTN